MALTQDRRQQLDGIVLKMAQQNAPKGDVQAVVSDFINKFGNEKPALLPPTAANPFPGMAERNVAVRDKYTPASVKGFGETLGLTGAVLGGVTGSINKSSVDEATARFNLAKQLRTATPEQAAHIKSQLGQGPAVSTATEQLPGLNKTTGKVASEALGTLGTIALGAAPATSLGGRLAVGTAIGAGAGLQSGLAQGMNATQIAKKTATGAALGLGIGLGAEALTAAIGAVAGAFKPGQVLTRELKPPTGELASDLERGIGSIGERASAIVDESGSPVYVGTVDEIAKTAKNEIRTYGQKLEDMAAESTALPIDRNEVTKEAMDRIQNAYSGLTQAQMNTIKTEFGRMPVSLDPSAMLDARRKYDSLITESAFSKMGDPTQALPVLTRQTLRTILKEKLIQAIDDPAWIEANQRVGIASDIKDLAFTRMAERAKSFLPTSVSKLISELFDHYLPAAATKAAPVTSIVGKTASSLLPPVRTGLQETLSR